MGANLYTINTQLIIQTATYQRVRGVVELVAWTSGDSQKPFVGHHFWQSKMSKSLNLRTDISEFWCYYVSRGAGSGCLRSPEEPRAPAVDLLFKITMVIMRLSPHCWSALISYK